MIMQELYNIVLTKGGEYIQDPEHRMQVIKVTFVVLMKLFSMVRNRIGGKKKGENSEHIECNCNSCKVWRAKFDHILHSNDKDKNISTNGMENKKSFSSFFQKIWKRKSSE
jgi:hypothetical protein